MPPIWLNTKREESRTAREKICVEYWPVCNTHGPNRIQMEVF